MTLRVRATLPSATRPAGGLLDVARPLPDQWWRGVLFSGNGCAQPVLRAECDFGTGGPQLDLEGSPGAASSFAPTMLRQGVECTALSGTPIEDLAEERIAYVREWVAGHVLQTGNFTEHDDGQGGTQNNPALVDATDVDPGVLPLVDAVACLEQHAADELFGALAFLHASPLVGTHLLSNRLIWRDGRLWRTASGNVVVISPGYTGEELYVTSEVFASSGGGETRDAELDRTTNTLSTWADDLVLSVFDPCWFGRVTTNVSLCAATP